MAARRTTEAIVIESTGAVTTPTEPEVFEQTADNTSTGAVEWHAEGTTIAPQFRDSLTISFAEMGISLATPWREEVTTKVIEAPEQAPVNPPTQAETKTADDESTDTGTTPPAEEA